MDALLQRAYGLALFDLGFADRALLTLSPLIRPKPCKRSDNHPCHGSIAIARSATIQLAATAYRALLKTSEPDARSIAYWSLADLKQYQFSDIELMQLRQHLKAAQGTPQISPRRICDGLGTR